MAVAASDPVGSDTAEDCRAYLHFTVNPPNRRGLHKIIIKLTGADLYHIQFVKCLPKSGDKTVISESDRIYFDQLGEIIENMVWDDSPVLKFED